jgi:hypothetical protein
MFPGDSSRSRENYRRSFLGNIAFHEPGRAHKNSARGLPTFEGKNSFGWKKGHSEIPSLIPMAQSSCSSLLAVARLVYPNHSGDGFGEPAGGP